MKKQYICPEMSVLDTQKILAGEGVNTDLPSASSPIPSTGDFNAKKGGMWGDEATGTATPVGGTAGTGKSALELPTQNRKIWSD